MKIAGKSLRYYTSHLQKSLWNIIDNNIYTKIMFEISVCDARYYVEIAHNINRWNLGYFYTPKWYNKLNHKHTRKFALTNRLRKKMEEVIGQMECLKYNHVQLMKAGHMKPYDNFYDWFNNSPFKGSCVEG